MANVVYDSGRSLVWGGGVNFVSDTMKQALISASYTPNAATDTTMTPLAANRLGTDLTVPATKSVVNDTTNHMAFWKTTGTIKWNSGVEAPASGSIAYVVLYKFTTNDAGSVPICADNKTLTANGSDITYTPASDANGGLFKAA